MWLPINVIPEDTHGDVDIGQNVADDKPVAFSQFTPNMQR